MMQVHVKGRGVAGSYTWELDETKADKVAEIARGSGYPLKATIEEAWSNLVIPVFSTSVAVVLHIALREAVSRRHAYLTLEHLLYVLAHDAEGERILTAVGVDLARLRRDLSAYLDGSIEQLPRGQQQDEPE